MLQEPIKNQNWKNQQWEASQLLNINDDDKNSILYKLFWFKPIKRFHKYLDIDGIFYTTLTVSLNPRKMKTQPL